MTSASERPSRFRLLRDVVVFQIKLGMEALLDLTLIPVSLGAAFLDLLFGNWRRPRWFHAVLRFGERCERWIDVWGVATPGSEIPPSAADSLLRDVEAMLRDPRSGSQKIQELRRWAAMRIAPDDSMPPIRGADAGYDDHSGKRSKPPI